MPPVSHKPSERTTGKLSRKLFLTILTNVTLMLARLFNQIANYMSVSHPPSAMEKPEADEANPQTIIQLAQIMTSSRDLNELLGDFLDIIIKIYSCSYASVYIYKPDDVAGYTNAFLAHSAGCLDLDDKNELGQRLITKQINIDTPNSMNRLVGRAIATRQPQVVSAKENNGFFEAAFPIVQSQVGHGGRILGVLDLFISDTGCDDQLSPFSARAITEIESMSGILALRLADLLQTPGDTSPVATRNNSSFLPDLQTVLTTSRQIAEAENNEEIIRAIDQLLQTSPFAYGIFLRPDETTVERYKAKVPMPLVAIHNRGDISTLSSLSAKASISPQLDTIEQFFSNQQNQLVLISDVDQTEMDLNQPSLQRTNSSFSSGLEKTGSLRELVFIARALGCRTAAFFPAVRNGRLLAFLAIGSTTNMPPLSNKQGLIEPYQNLLSLVATGLDRVRARQNTERQFVELETFWRVSQAISFETDIDALYTLIHQQVEQAMGKISSIAIVLYDADINLVSIPYLVEEGERLIISPFPLGKGFSSEIIRTRQSLLMLTEQEIDAKTIELEAMQVGESPKSWLGVPMLFSGQVIGLIIVQDVKEEYRFTSQDDRLLSMLATQVAVVIRNARLLEATRRQAHQERLVNEISDHIRRQVDVQSILKTTTRELSRALGARRATIRIDPQMAGFNPHSMSAIPEDHLFVSEMNNSASTQVERSKVVSPTSETPLNGNRINFPDPEGAQ